MLVIHLETLINKIRQQLTTRTLTHTLTHTITMSTAIYTYEEVAKHNQVKDAWVVIASKVYNITGFLDEHPGGEEIIFENAGGDATENFLDIGHSEDALKILKSKYIGDMDPSSKPLLQKVTKPTEKVKKSQGNPTLALLLAIVCLIVGYYVLND